MLAQNPQRGRTCDEIRLGYRKYPIGRHLIFYREVQEGIEIIRVLHNRMNMEVHLDDRSLDLDYLNALSDTLSEWASSEDEEAYRDL